MLSGFCIAGVDEAGTWSRPIKRSNNLVLGDVSYPDRTMMQPFDRVRFEVVRRLPDPPHVEDRICDFVRQRPRRVGQLTAVERADFLASHADPDATQLLAFERSLLLLRADEVSASFQLDAYSGKYEARVQIPGVSYGRGVPCTDLRWRALGRTLVPKGGSLDLAPTELRERLHADEIYLALGLARQFDGQYWPLVVGVHPIPDFEVVVDPKNP